MKSGPRVPDEIPVYVVVPPRVLLLDIAGPLEALRMANAEQNQVRFVASYVGPLPQVASSIGLEITGIAPLPQQLPDDALVLLAGSVDVPMRETQQEAGERAWSDETIVGWLRSVLRPGVRLASICSGALLAARAGLLDGKDCTTHHGAIEDLRRLAPTARVLENRLFVIDGDLLTSAGVTAGLDLVLHLIAETVGHAAAVAVARDMVVYLRRGGADPQLSPWLEGRNHIHPAIHRAQDAIAGDPGRSWSVPSLARIAAASPRNLSRLFNEHTGMSVTAYVNRMRVALAHELVTGSRLDMEAVAERAGFGSARQFRRAWNRLYPTPPRRMRTEINRSEDNDPIVWN